MKIRVSAVIALLPVLAVSAAAQDSTELRPEGVTTTATGVVRVPAHSVRLSVGVEVEAPTATEAAAMVADVTHNVLAALEKIGLSREHMPSNGYSVATDYDWESGERTGYTATSSLAVELEDPSRIGAVVDSALAGGANEISNIEFLPENRRAARDRALRSAFEQARRDARILASAAGARLGRLLSMTTGARGTFTEEIIVTAEAPGTHVPVPEVVISAGLQARWELIFASP